MVLNSPMLRVLVCCSLAACGGGGSGADGDLSTDEDATEAGEDDPSHGGNHSGDDAGRPDDSDPGADEDDDGAAVGDGDDGTDIDEADSSEDGGACEGDACCAARERPTVGPCGINDRGHYVVTCEDGDWRVDCVDPDECADGDVVRFDDCDGQAGQTVRRCVVGRWESECVPPCEDGSFQLGDTACDAGGRLLQTCSERRWRDSTQCVLPPMPSSHADDTELARQEQDGTLPYVCPGAALTTAQIIDHFPAGSPIWTPASSGSLPIPGESATRLHLAVSTRSCNELTGCGPWYADTDSSFSVDMVVGWDGLLYARHNGTYDGHSVFVPMGEGRALLTIADSSSTSLATSGRLLLKVTPGCFSMTTLIARDGLSASWDESYAGTKVVWTWPPPARHPQDPPPRFDPDPCPPRMTSAQELAAAWFEPGATYVAFRPDPPNTFRKRFCTTLTGCAPWSDPVSVSNTPTLTIRGGSTLELVALRSYADVASDGTFDNGGALTGHMTPECIHAAGLVITPWGQGLTGSSEIAREQVLTLADRM